MSPALFLANETVKSKYRADEPARADGISRNGSHRTWYALNGFFLFLLNWKETILPTQRSGNKK